MLNKHFAWSFIFMAIACGKPSSSKLAADATGRHVLGEAIELGARRESLPSSSFLEQRAHAWRLVQKLVQPSRQERVLLDGREVSLLYAPLFSWYSAEDFDRWLQVLLRDGAQPPFSLAAIKAAKARLSNELLELPPYMQNKLRHWLNAHQQIDDAALMSLLGLPHTVYSGGLMQATLRNAESLLDCFPARRLPNSDEAHTPCWSEPLPESSVAVKFFWHNMRTKIPVFATDAQTLSTMQSMRNSSWTAAQIASVDADSSLFQAQTEQGAFALPAIHIMAKEQADWLWISLFWSPTPDSDFGEDRPLLPAPWSNYKMCVVGSFQVEYQDLDHARDRYPSLYAAYQAAVTGNPGASWCSNPYIESEANNQRTNCIGCHQFAGSRLRISELLSGGGPFRQFGSLRQRTDHPGDYLHSAVAGGQSFLSILRQHLRPYEWQDIQNGPKAP